MPTLNQDDFDTQVPLRIWVPNDSQQYGPKAYPVRMSVRMASATLRVVR